MNSVPHSPFPIPSPQLLTLEPIISLIQEESRMITALIKKLEK